MFSILYFSCLTFAQDVSERLAELENAAANAQASADNAWVLLCSALVFLMTVPGLALFYGGLGQAEKCAFDNA